MSKYFCEKAREIEAAIRLGSDKDFQNNSCWGTLDRYSIVGGVKVRHNQETLSERINFYHKPQINFIDLSSRPADPPGYSLRFFWLKCGSR